MKMEKFRNHIKRNKRKYIVYGFLAAVLIALFSIYLTAKITDNSFIENAYDTRMEQNLNWYFINGTIKPDAPPLATFDGFLSEYVDDFFIYVASAFVILWIARRILHAMKKRISPDIHNTLHVLVRSIVLPIFIIAYISKFEPFTGSIIGVAATLGAAFGIAAAKSVGDLLAGLALVFSKHHNVGDYIFIPELNIEGVVKKISVTYMTIRQPNETKAVIPIRKIREHEIINIAIAEYEEKEEDHHKDISDLFLYGERIAETDYVYPAKWAVHSDESHEICVKAIEKTAKEYNNILDEPVEWRISSRDRLNRRYEIKLQVLDPEKLLTLVTDFMKSLEKNYEKEKSKK
jgi:hypothetical protein